MDTQGHMHSPLTDFFFFVLLPFFFLVLLFLPHKGEVLQTEPAGKAKTHSNALFSLFPED